MISYQSCSLIVYNITDIENKKNVIDDLLLHCNQKTSLYYNKNKILLSCFSDKKNLILLTDIEFYTLIKYKYHRKMLFHHIKNNNIMLSDNIEGYYINEKKGRNDFLLNKKLLKFYKYLKLKITIHIDCSIRKKIIKNMTNLIIDLYLANNGYIENNYLKNNLKNTIYNYLPSSIKILRIDNIKKIKKNKNFTK